MGFGVWGLGFGVWGLGFGVWGLGFGVGVWGLGFGVSGRWRKSNRLAGAGTSVECRDPTGMVRTELC